MRIWPTNRFWKRLAIGAAIVVALALIANGLVAWWVEHQLQTKIAAIRAAGDPASIADLAPVPVPADQNAAAILQQLGPRLDEFAKEHGRFFNTPIGKTYNENQDHGLPPTSDQIEAIRTIVDKYPDLAVGLTAAAACEEYASLSDFSLNSTDYLQRILDEHLPIRTAARFSGWRMEVMLADAESQRAAELGLESLRIARLHDDEPLLINFLIGVAIRSIAAQGLYDTMAAGPISPQLHAAIDHELAQHDDPQRIIRVLKDERAFGIDTFDPMLADAPRSIRHLIGWPVKRYYVGVLEAYDSLLERRIVPQNPTGHGVLADLMVPSLKAAYDANARSTAILRALRIFNALTQYRDERGHEASGLEELSLPNEATIDPFSGEPIKLKHTQDGWIIYSVMQNGVDDGGDFKDLKDYGLAPPKLRLTQ